MPPAPSLPEDTLTPPTGGEDREVSETLILVGAGGNLGRAAARRFGSAGFHVALVGRDPEKLQAQALELRAAAVSVEVEVAEATDLASVDRAVRAILERRGAPDVLLYNAAVVKGGALVDMPLEAIAHDLLVNAGAAMAAARAVLPPMVARGRGTVLFTSGGLIHAPQPAYTSLSVGKFALNALAQCLAKDPALGDIHVAQLVVHAHISETVGEHLAGLYLELHRESKGSWRTEVLYPV